MVDANISGDQVLSRSACATVAKASPHARCCVPLGL